MNIQVNPSPYVKPPINIGNVQISIRNIELFKSVSVQVLLFDANNSYIDTKIFDIRDGDYLKWENDDNYVVDYVLNQLNLTRMDIQPIQPEDIQPIQPEDIQPIQPEDIQPIQPEDIQPIQPEDIQPIQPETPPEDIQPIQPETPPEDNPSTTSLEGAETL